MNRSRVNLIPIVEERHPIMGVGEHLPHASVRLGDP